MRRWLSAFAGAMLLLSWSPPPSVAQEDRLLTGGEPSTLSLPFAFYNSSFGAAGGYVHGETGWPNPDSAVIAAAIAGTQGSAMAFLIGQNLHLSFAPRLMVDPIASFGYFNDVDSYGPGDPGFATQRAGSNSSSADNFITGSGFDYYVRAKLKYLLPIGDGADEIFETYEVDRGLLVSGAEGGTSWNPLESGRTFIGLRPFYRSQEINGDAGDRQLKTNGLDLNLFWDNRDFSPNPSLGGSVNLTLSRDFGLFDTTNSWTVLQAEIDRYISLGATKRFRQRVLALDAWTAVSPTWEKEAGQVSRRAIAEVGG